jgi:hypothetical protein
MYWMWMSHQFHQIFGHLWIADGLGKKDHCKSSFRKKNVINKQQVVVFRVVSNLQR